MKELFTALAKAQLALKPLVKDATNPHFRSKYSTLAACWDACREALGYNNIAVIQYPEVVNNSWMLKTTIAHCSGEELSGYVPIITDKNSAQAFGSALTYARRYGLMAMVGIAPEDDDGEDASKLPQDQREPEGTHGYGSAGENAAARRSGQQNQEKRSSQADYERANPNWESEACTEKQRSRMWAMAQAKGISEHTLKEEIKARFGKDSSKVLTKGEIQVLFKAIETAAGTTA